MTEACLGQKLERLKNLKLKRSYFCTLGLDETKRSMDKAGPKNNNCRVDNELNKMVKKKNSFVLDFGSCCCCLVSGKNCSVVLRQTVSHGKLHRFLGHRKCLSSKKNPSFLQIMIPCFSNSELEPSEG